MLPIAPDKPSLSLMLRRPDVYSIAEERMLLACRLVQGRRSGPLFGFAPRRGFSIVPTGIFFEKVFTVGLITK